MKLLKNLFSSIGSIASLIGLILTFKDSDTPFSTWQWLLIIVSAGLFLLLIYFIIKDYFDSKPIVLKDKKSIRNYMFNWINSGGRAVIFTRDMSWVSDDEMREMLNLKAKRRELIICMPKKIDKIIEFEQSGALIIEYSDLGYTPLSRFTIINFGRADAKVAVGKSLSYNKHLIEEYESGRHPYFQVANDLVNMLESNMRK